MTDVFEPEARSYIMSRIKKTDTKPEIKVRKYLFKNGFRFRIHDKHIMGNPDIVLKKYKTVIFVNGCFWHAHKGCKLNKPPKSNLNYWLPKIKKNVERDKNNQIVLTVQGWKVLTVWECELEGRSVEVTLENLIKKLRS
jgi:DNA mismatch endonuclease (patch repair protein)